MGGGGEGGYGLRRGGVPNGQLEHFIMVAGLRGVRVGWGGFPGRGLSCLGRRVGERMRSQEGCSGGGRQVDCCPLHSMVRGSRMTVVSVSGP